MDVHPKSQIGVCLDIDGTLYRSGSAFVETLIRMPDVPNCSFTATERAQLREALGIVGRYQGGRATAWRWRSSLRLVDVFRALGMTVMAERVLARLLAAQAWLDSVTPARGGDRTPKGGYEELRTALLHQYGTVIAGHDSTTVTRGVKSLFQQLKPITPGMPAVCADARQAGVGMALVTNMPEHVAQPYAETILPGSVQAVVGTDFETDGNQFTGTFDPVDKRAAVAQLRDRYGWKFVIAAGDTGRDLPMATTADHFIAVSGQGNIRTHLNDPVVLDTDDQSLPHMRDVAVSYVPPEQELSGALRLILGAAGDIVDAEGG